MKTILLQITYQEDETRDIKKTFVSVEELMGHLELLVKQHRLKARFPDGIPLIEVFDLYGLTD